MDHKTLRTLKLLEAFTRKPSPTQRELARELEISLGLVNASIKKLVGKGLFKINSGRGTRCKFTLTAKGKSEKIRLKSDYRSHAFDFYKSSKSKMTDLFNELYAKGIDRVAFYGTNEFAEIAYVALHQTPIELVAVFDETNKGSKFFDYNIQGVDNLPITSFQKLIIAANHTTKNELKKLENVCLSDNNIIYI